MSEHALTEDDFPPHGPQVETFNIDDWISGATRPETVVMLSSKGKEYGEFKVLELELMKAQRAVDDDPDDRLVSVANTEPVRIATEMDRLSKVIEAGRRPFRLRGLSEADLKTLRATTKDMVEDETTAHMLSLCCINPALTAVKWNELRQVLGEGQWAQLLRESNRVSFGEAADVPFSVAASVALRTQEY